MVSRVHRIVCVLCTAAWLTGCAGGHTLARLDTLDRALAGPVAWYSPAAPADRTVLAHWRASVGAPVIRETSSALAASADEISVVTWNAALGDGDIVALVRELERSRGRRPIVLLLQEVYRRGDAVPLALTPNAGFARRLGSAPNGTGTNDIGHVAAELDMAAYYVPSMRNGGASSNEDRGNAILSNIPISHLEAIELPFERQRRVAVSAFIEGTTSGGRPWRLRVVSAHLDNTITKRAWIGSEYGRARQARGLVALLGRDVPTLLGGDFNTWFGFTDQAYTETVRAFPQTPTDERRPTFRGVLRLDHFFCRLPAGWRATARRADQRYGSDHSPLIGSIRFN